MSVSYWPEMLSQLKINEGPLLRMFSLPEKNSQGRLMIDSAYLSIGTIKI